MNSPGTIDYKLLYEQQLSLTTELEFKIQVLTHQLDQLKKMIFGSRSERFIPSTPGVTQGVLFEKELTEGEACSITETREVSYLKTKITKGAPVDHPGRMKLPSHLRREIITIEPEEEISGCKKIGEEITEELDYLPGELYVNQYVRPKYLCLVKEEVVAKKNRGEDGDSTHQIVIAEMPVRPLHKCIAGPGLLVQVAIDKYVDHLPLNRQLQRFSRVGVNLPISTITGWVSGVCELIKPVWEALLYLVLNAGYIHVDETTMKVLDKDKKGKTHLGYFWVYTDSIHGLAYFDYQPGRGREGPEEILKDFKGYIQTDGYEVYEQFDKRADITQLCCMAHARRKFHEALNNDKARAGYALTQIRLLYDIERECKDYTDEARKKIRQQKAVPILNELGKWMQDEYIKVPPKSAIGLALAYSLNRWDKLKIYTTDGKLCIDNNPVERSLRPVTLGRKNYLFCGSHEAAKRAGMLYSLLGTCKLHDMNPYEWLKEVITKLPTHPNNRMDELLPHIWCQQRSTELAD
ncbi:MAG: IS66 family transposase [Chitinophagaceae bacterium]|nr:MAG: IS66 family transposase [Chitinophagaceae bacterium]